MSSAHNARHPAQTPAVAIVGGGLAGLAAAVAAAENGLCVHLFEGRSQLGGRAASMVDEATGHAIDCSQHVAMGCCTNFLDFCRRVGGLDLLGPPASSYTFYDPAGGAHRFAASPWLPAPLHLMPALARLGFLGRGDRWRIARAMMRLGRARADDDETMGRWLARQGQSAAAVELFWSPIIVSALSETVDRASLAAAQKVFRDGFLAARGAYRLVVPSRPLGELFERAAAWLARRGASIHTATEVQQIEGDAGGGLSLRLADGTRRAFDSVIVAVPWWQTGRLLGDAWRAPLPFLSHIEEIEPAPITAVHLWYRHRCPVPPHAMLLGRTSQWLFDLTARSPSVCERMGTGSEPVREDAANTASCEVPVPILSQAPSGSPAGFSYQVVISASHALVDVPDDEIIARVCRELSSIFNGAGEEDLLHARVMTHRRAVFSVRPGVEKHRPAQETAVGNLVLAGDWTATGWPATMEGAVRSGRLAVEALLRRLGRPAMLLTPDLPRSPLARLVLKDR